MSIKNEHIVKYIADYYCKTPFPPGFAVLITGRWGSGKTHLIKSLFGNQDSANQKIPHIYIVSTE
jgi:chromosomal replication initiation ATPase DnaA